MKRTFEKTYGNAVRSVMKAVNPMKKKVINTHCNVHKYINTQGLNILKEEGYIKEFEFFKEYIVDINEGAHWIDQDFKSTNHFYHATKERGLYGFSNALTECIKYSNKSLANYKIGDVRKAMFFLGASCHLIQDMTVPHHVDNRLLNKHRAFELWIVRKLSSNPSLYAVDKGIVRYGTVENYIKGNSKMAREIYSKFKYKVPEDEKYSSIASVILVEAQKTTAGFLLDFYENLTKIKG